MSWASRFGVSGSTHDNGVALDPTTGDVLMTGYFVGSTNFAGGTLTGGDAGDGAFVVRFTSAGAYVSEAVFGSGEAEAEPASIAVDGAGNVIMGGQFQGTTNLGTGTITSSGDQDIFLLKYGPTGAIDWVDDFGAAGSYASLDQVVVGATGDVFVTGNSGGAPLDLGCGALASGGTFFLAEFNPSGDCVWSTAPTVMNAFTSSWWLALDPLGDVVVASGFYGTMNFGNGELSAPGNGMDAFVAKFSGSGSILWAQQFGVGASVAEVTGVATDACGNILIDGTFSQTLDLGCGTLTESGDTGNGDIFLAKLDPSGACVWSESFGDPSAQVGGPLVVDSSGGPALTGYFNGTVDFGGGNLQGAAEGNESMYIANFNSAGVYRWAYAGGPPASDALNSVGLALAASATSVVTTGEFQDGTLSLAGDAFTAQSSLDAYVAKFAP